MFLYVTAEYKTDLNQLNQVRPAGEVAEAERMLLGCCVLV